MNEDWTNQLAALLQQDQDNPYPQEDYWSMMAAQDTIPAFMSDAAKEAYINKIQGGGPQRPQQPSPQQVQQLKLQNDAARRGQAKQTPQEIQAMQLAEIMRRRALGQ